MAEQLLTVAWFAISNPLTVIGAISFGAYVIRQKMIGEEI